MTQEQGLIGRLVGGMIRRSVRHRLRNLYWEAPPGAIFPPAIFYANHHGWLDGYLMFHLMIKLNLPSIAWVEEFDAFPLFARVGGLRFARDDGTGRAVTVRQTIRAMRSEGRSLVVFPEGVLHRPHDIWPLGRALEVVAKAVPSARLVPVAILYELSMHERPEAWISVGESHEFLSLGDSRARLREGLDCLRARIKQNSPFPVLAPGTPSVNERMDMRRMPKWR